MEAGRAQRLAAVERSHLGPSHAAKGLLEEVSGPLHLAFWGHPQAVQALRKATFSKIKAWVDARELEAGEPLAMAWLGLLGAAEAAVAVPDALLVSLAQGPAPGS